MTFSFHYKPAAPATECRDFGGTKGNRSWENLGCKGCAHPLFSKKSTLDRRPDCGRADAMPDPIQNWNAPDVAETRQNFLLSQHGFKQLQILFENLARFVE